MRRIVKLVPYLVILLVLVIAAVFILRSGPLAKRLRETITAELEHRTGREVGIGGVTMIGAGRAKLSDVTIKEQDGGLLLSAPEVTLRTGQGGFLRRLVTLGEIREIAFHRPKLRIARRGTGKWDIADLLERTKGKTRFTGTVTVDDGSVALVDEMRGGLVTTLDEVDLTTRSDDAGKTRFRLSAVGAKRAFAKLQIQGEYDSASGAATCSGAISKLDLVYASGRLPQTKAFAALAGHADATGTVTIRRAAQALEVIPDLRIDAREVQITFPWLRQPLTSASGHLRLVGERLTIVRATADLAGLPTAVTGTITGFAKPQLALDLSTSGLEMKQAKALLPAVTFPAGLAVPVPMRIEAKVRGGPPDITVDGRASAKEVLLGCVPWHDFAARFCYRRGRLDVTEIRAHGSPRRLEGDLQMLLGPPGKQQTKAHLVLRDVPLRMLAGCAPELGPLDVGGTATIALEADIREGGQIAGSFAARGVRYRGYTVGVVRGDFALGASELRIARGTVEGPTATGVFSLTASRAGRYEAKGDLSALDLGALGITGLAGVMRGNSYVAGSAKEGGSGHISLVAIGPGPVRALSADFQMTPERLALRNLRVQPARGEITGELGVTDGNRLEGRLEVSGVPVREWVPRQYLGLLPAGEARGTVVIGGTAVEPRIRADLQIERLSVVPLGQGVGRVRVEYARGVLTVEELTLEVQKHRITARGEYLPPHRLDIEITEAQTDLAVLSLLTQPRWGFTPSGPATVSAQIRVRPSDPEVTFAVTSHAAAINGVPVQDLEVSGSVRHGVLALDTARLRQAGGYASATGSVDLVTQRVNLQVEASEVDLSVFSPWTRRSLGLDLSGLATAEATISGPPGRREGSLRLSANRAVANQLALQGVELKGRLEDGVLTVDSVSFQQEGASFKASGTANHRTKQLDLSVGLNSLDLRSVMLAFARAASRLSYFGQTDALLKAYAAIPGPLGGTLTAGVKVTGSYERPEVAADLSLEQLSFNGSAVESVGGTVRLTLHAGGVEGAFMDLVATQQEAVAEVSGEVTPGGAIVLKGELNYVDLKVLSPWLRPLAGIEGRASVSLDVSGTVDDPLLVGSVFIDGPSWGRFAFEAATVALITLRGAALSLQEIHLRKGPMLARGDATLQLRASFRPFRVSVLPTATADLSITGGSYAPITGMTPAEFNADLHLVGNRLAVWQSIEEGTPESSLPGIRGRMGDGRFSVSGEVRLPPSYGLADLRKSEFDLTADLDPVDLVIPDFITAKLGGKLLVVTSKEGGPLLKTAEGAPLELSDGVIGVPPSGLRFAATPLGFVSDVDVRVVAGDRLSFEYDPVDALIEPGSGAAAQPVSYVDIGGRSTASGVTVHGEAQSRKGELAFPNAELEVLNARASVDREPGQPMRVRVLEAEAAGRVGDYQIVLNPSGQVYPAACYDPECVPLDLGIRTVPYLDPAYALALLIGPVVAPTMGAGLDTLSVLSATRRPMPTTGALTGFLLPGLGIPNVSLQFSFEGPLALRLQERLFGRLHVQYVSPLTGPAETRRVGITYQATPRYSVGFSTDALDNTRYQAQRYWTF